MVKDSILALLDLMTDQEAANLLEYIKSNYVLVPKRNGETDAKEMPGQREPDFGSFVSEAEALRVLGLSE